MDLAPDIEQLVLPKLRKQDASVHFPDRVLAGSWRCLKSVLTYNAAKPPRDGGRELEEHVLSPR